jgi:hypothetical protein
MFALTAKRSENVIGYFEPTDSANPSAARFFVRR